VSFVDTRAADFTLNVANARRGNTDLGDQNGFAFIQFTPTVNVNNIVADFSGQSPITINHIIGIVGAHELMHRTTGIGDLPFDPNNPNDLMSSDANAKNDWNLLGYNGYKFTPAELQKVSIVCHKINHH
jgi:hypothetical protein